MSALNLKHFLDDQHVKYTSIAHAETYTAQETAQSAHIPGREMVKTVIFKADGGMAMVILPATDKVDLGLLASAIHADSVKLASETEFKRLFPDCETGAMPPFGNLYDMPVYIEESVCDNTDIAFNAGSHSELIRISYKDYDRLVHPMNLRVSRKYTH